MKYHLQPKRIFALMLSLILSLSLLTACGDDTESSPVSSDAESVSTAEDADSDGSLSNEELLQMRKEPTPVVAVEEEENLTTVIEGMGNGLEATVAEGFMDENPNRTITRSTTAIPQIRATDMYGNVLGDEFYFYRNQLSDVGKKAYDQLYLGAAQCQETVDLSVAIPAGDFLNIYYAMQYDHPELFWLDTSYYSYYENNQGIVTTAVLYYNDLVNDLDQNYANFYAAALSYCQNAANYSSNKIDQVKYINDVMCNIITYQAGAPYNQSAYSSLQLASTVCAGYAKGFQYCMHLLGIPAAYMVGYAGELHAWNLVELDGEYYNMDVTWNDVYPTPGQYDYNYFNITDNQISADHQRTSITCNLPAANATYYSYNNFYGGNCYGTDFTNFQPLSEISIYSLPVQVNNILSGNATFIDNTSDGSGMTSMPTDTQQNNDDVYVDEYDDSDYDDSDYDDFDYDDSDYDDSYYDDSCSDDFDWDAYYDSLDTWENYDGYCPAGIGDGVYSDDLGDYIYYDYEYDIYYYYDYDYEAYVGYDEYDSFILEYDGWYYWE